MTPANNLHTNPSLPRELWQAWNAYAHRAAAYQSTALLTLVYFVVVGPSALGARLARTKLLDLDTRPRESYWIERKPLDNSLDALKRQF